MKTLCGTILAAVAATMALGDTVAERERRADEIAAKAGERLPLPWDETERLVAGWKGGTPTKVYHKMGIYP